MNIPFSPPYIDDDVKREVMQTLESGWITSGKRVLELEQMVASFVGLNHVACCNSATSALMLVLHWFGVKRGDEVIIPAYTYAATALAVMHVGATPVMVDCGPDFNIDVTKIRGKINSRTKAIIPVDIAGWPCDYESIKELANEDVIRKQFVPAGEVQKKLNRILILSDAAHSIGATLRGKSCAQLSDITVFSFHAVKNITTAEGGAICINLPVGFDDGEVYKTFKLWSLNGQTKDALSKTQGAGWKYDIVYPGFKMNMPDLCAAIGIAQLKKYSLNLHVERRRVFMQYKSRFSKFSWTELPPFDSDGKTTSCHLFALRIRNISEDQRDAMIKWITETGVSVNVHFQPLPLLTLFRERGFSIEDFPVAYDCYSREISLPIYPELNSDLVDHVVDQVNTAYETVVHAQANV